MIVVQQAPVYPGFTSEQVSEQLGKILGDPIFAHADILKRFLSFIVCETLKGNTNQLKEYTIGTQVLQKPANFNTQESGIVRIHAGRLRRALNLYYRTKGQQDGIRIAIPLGHYVPVFSDNRRDHSDWDQASVSANPKKKLLVSVIPIHDLYDDPLSNSAAEHLCGQLSAALMHLDTFSVVAHYARQSSRARITDVLLMGKALGAHWVVATSIRPMKDQLSVSIQIIETESGNQVLSNSYQKSFDASSIFAVQDEMVRLVIRELELLTG